MGDRKGIQPVICNLWSFAHPTNSGSKIQDNMTFRYQLTKVVLETACCVVFVLLLIISRVYEFHKLKINPMITGSMQHWPETATDFSHIGCHTAGKRSWRRGPITAPDTSIVHDRVRLRQHPQRMATAELQTHAGNQSAKSKIIICCK